MTTVTISAFDLPDRLAAKDDPALIGGDEQHFAALAAALEESIDRPVRPTRAERRAPGGGGQQALERDLEIHRLTARLRALRRFGLDLCLGRIVRADGSEPVYVGRLGLTDRTGRQLLVDWRSPAAEPFFGATHANPMGLVSRRRYRWTGGRIGDYWDEVFTADGFEGHAAALDDESAFIASLGSSRSAQMRDVLGTIQADQDAIIRAGSRGALVVDGGPGTGKTVVALHRTAYLLYSDPRLGHRRGGVLVVGPHRPYLSYVADVLPEPRRGGRADLHGSGPRPGGRDGAAEADPRWRGSSRRREMVSAIEPAVRLYEEPPARGMEVETPYGDLWLSAADWAEAFARPPARRTTRPATTSSRSWSRSSSTSTTTTRSRRSRCGGRWPRTRSCSPLSTARGRWSRRPTWSADLWSVPAYLRRCAPWLAVDEVRALQREDPQAWTVSDLPLLDAARQRLGDPEASRRRRRRDAAARGRAGGDGQGRRPPHRDRRLGDAPHVDAAGPRPAGRPGRRVGAARPPTPTCWPVRSRTSSWTRRRS